MRPLSFWALEDLRRNVPSAAELHHSSAPVKLFAVAVEVEQWECSKMPVVGPKLLAHLIEKTISKKGTIQFPPAIDYQSTIENYGKFDGLVKSQIVTFLSFRTWSAIQ